MKKLILFALLFSINTDAAIWLVGSSQIYTNPSDVVSLVSFGDTIEIEAGIYAGDFCIWNTDQLYIKGVGGYAHLFCFDFAASQTYLIKELSILQ